MKPHEWEHMGNDWNGASWKCCRCGGICNTSYVHEDVWENGVIVKVVTSGARNPTTSAEARIGPYYKGIVSSDCDELIVLKILKT